MPQRGSTSRPSLFIVVSMVALCAASTGTARAADECIVKPNAEPPQGQHWYYRTDRDSKRQCWYLGPQGVSPPKAAAQALKESEADTRATSAAAPSDAASMSPQEREALFRKFIEWRQSHPAQHAQ